MPRLSALLLVSAMIAGIALAPSSRAAADTNWPFELLPRPSNLPATPPPPVIGPLDEDLPAIKPQTVTPETGVYIAPKDLTIKLNRTENKSFLLSGEVWLDGPSPASKYAADRPDGFQLYLRSVDSLHRYEADSRLMRVKRRLFGGEAQTKIVPIAKWPNFPLHRWIPFALVATAENITFTFGDYTGEIRGPLDTNGSNEIGLVAGTRLRNVHLGILDDAKNSNGLVVNP
jgi:hypothetical protein